MNDGFGAGCNERADRKIAVLCAGLCVDGVPRCGQAFGNGASRPPAGAGNQHISRGIVDVGVLSEGAANYGCFVQTQFLSPVDAVGNPSI